MAADDDNLSDKTMIMTPSAMSGERSPAPRSRLVCRNPDVLGSPAGQEILLDGAQVTIGRGAEHDVTPKADGISRNHAKFFPGDGAWGVEDLGSTNGVLVNGSKAKQAWLKSGDVVVLGTVQYAFEHLPEARADEEYDAMREAEKTVVMRPTVKTQATAAAAASQAEHKPAARPSSPGSATARGHAGARASTGASRGMAREKPRSGSGMMLIVALAVAVAAVLGFVFLG